MMGFRYSSMCSRMLLRLCMHRACSLTGKIDFCLNPNHRLLSSGVWI